MSWRSKAKSRIKRITEEVEDIGRARRNNWDRIERDSIRDLRGALSRAWQSYRDTGAKGYGYQQRHTQLWLLIHPAEALLAGELTTDQALEYPFGESDEANEWWASRVAAEDYERARAEQRTGMLRATHRLTSLTKACKRALLPGPLRRTLAALKLVVNAADVKTWYSTQTPPRGVTVEEWDAFYAAVIEARRVLQSSERSSRGSSRMENDFALILIDMLQRLMRNPGNQLLRRDIKELLGSSRARTATGRVRGLCQGVPQLLRARNPNEFKDVARRVGLLAAIRWAKRQGAAPSRDKQAAIAQTSANGNSYGDEGGYGDEGDISFHRAHPVITMLGATGALAATIVAVVVLTKPKGS